MFKVTRGINITTEAEDMVKDGVVVQLNIEQGGEFKVSSAEHLLAQL